MALVRYARSCLRVRSLQPALRVLPQQQQHQACNTIHRSISSLVSLPRPSNPSPQLLLRHRRHMSSTLAANPDNAANTPKAQIPLGKPGKELYIEYTCKPCNTRNRGFMSKVAYEKGVVICTCSGCKERHLIADHLGWFQHLNGRTVEEFMAQKGETVRKHILTDRDIASILPPE